jgi:carbon-monoxide dehydrogenase medium subunit
MSRSPTAPTVRTALPALAALAGGIGDPQVRARGTMGGSVANNDPAADYPAAVLACRAQIVTDRRSIEADDVLPGHVHHCARPRRADHRDPLRDPEAGRL